MKKKFKSLFSVSSAIIAGSLLLSSLATVVITAVSAAFVIDAMPSFQSTIGTDVFYCYKISGEGNENKVAVAWGKKPAETPDDTLTIPATLTSDNSSDTNTYTVAAIANSGFHRCDFKYVSLPETIEEIGKGAFAYCEKLLDIRIPHLVDTIAPSTFVSCRALKTITYSENVGTEQAPVYSATSSNTVITRIEDHAFDSCVSLIQFECPKSLTYIGKSAFQNCNKITRFYLPQKAAYGDITIDSYAFADCTSLSWVYFEENVTTVNDYAFVDCKSDMLFHYGYDISGGAQNNPEFSTYWRRKSLKANNTAVYDYDDTTNSLIRSADGYPGLKIAIDSIPITLDSWRSGETSTNAVTLDSGAGGYAIIYQWDNPGKTVRKTGDDFDYYNVGSGADGDGILCIPHTVTSGGVDYPVKVIAKEAFKECKDIKEVHFKNATVGNTVNGVVQIQKNAFDNCTNLQVIDFDGVTTLKEISGEVFGRAKMANVSAIKLPASLQYIGPYAFYNFVNTSILKFTTPSDDAASRISSLYVIGDHAFYNIGQSLSSGNYLHVTLPCSLDDSKAKPASMHASGKNWYAVGEYAFGGDTSNNRNGNTIATLTMMPCNGHSGHNSSLKTSFAPNAFNGAKHLVRFTANVNLCMIGSNAFSGCSALKEVFLTTARAASYAGNSKYVWGTTDAGSSAGDSIFGGSSCPNLVIYLDGNVPGKIGTYTDSSDTSGKTRWNAEGSGTSTFDNGLGFNNAAHSQSRRIIPTYTSIDFSEINKSSLIYYKPSNGTTLTSSPDTDSDYFSGLITFVKEGSNYSVAHYYTNNTNKTLEIDLRNVSHTYSGTTINISSSLTKIGNAAFAGSGTGTGATQQAPCPGKFFILPTTVTTIEERAFYRYAGSETSHVENNGVAVVTTDSSGTPLGGVNTTYALIKNDFNTNKYGYCNIPNVTSIGNDAFFNNTFKEITLSSSLGNLGKSAFYNRYGSKLTNVTFTSTNAYFEVINNGIYYYADSSKKALLYQIQNNNGATTLTLDDGTKAIGPGALAKANYQTVNLVEGLTQIYGSAFRDNTELQTLGIKSGDANSLEYISANPYLVTAYKIEKYKYLIGLGAQTTHVDDLSHFGYIDDAHKTSSGPQVPVSFVEEGNVTSLWPFQTTTGMTIYGSKKTVDNDTFMYQIPSATADSDVLSRNDSLPFGLVDYRETINPSIGDTRNRNSAFYGCSTLKMVDFRSMTELKKIGHAAFKNCTNLMDADLGRTYNYYSYNKSTKTISLTETKTKNVLDLSACTKLVSIGYEAFNGCTKISYAHLPFTDGRLFVRFDPHTANGAITGSVFSNTGTIKILVGDKEIKANNKTHSAFGGLSKHYPSDWQGSNPIYYYAPDGGEKSLYAGNTAVKYWTQDTTKDPYGYILFEDYTAAKSYFDNIGSVVWPS